MNCLNPLKLFEIDKDTKKVYGKEVDHVEVYTDGSIHPAKTKHVSRETFRAIFSYMEIPCRTCYGCRKDHARMWSERIMAELPYYDSSYFLTLTYNDDNIPVNDRGYNTLCTRDLQLFWKKLRKIQSNPIKYFACGEYGTTSHRPHYHAIVFGLELDDLVLHSHDYAANTDLYTSYKLSELWNNGFVSIGEVTQASARYVAGYVDKKLEVNRSNYYYKQLGIEPEKLYISNGIGERAYYDKVKSDLFDKNYEESYFDDVVIHNNSYYSNKFKREHPERHENWIDTLEKQAKADKRARRILMPDSVYYDSLDRENEFKIKNMKKRGD